MPTLNYSRFGREQPEGENSKKREYELILIALKEGVDGLINKSSLEELKKVFGGLLGAHESTTRHNRTMANLNLEKGNKHLPIIIEAIDRMKREKSIDDLSSTSSSSSEK